MIGHGKGLNWQSRIEISVLKRPFQEAGLERTKTGQGLSGEKKISNSVPRECGCKPRNLSGVGCSTSHRLIPQGVLDFILLTVVHALLPLLLNL